MIGDNYEADMLENARINGWWPEWAEANAGVIEFIGRVGRKPLWLLPIAL